MDFVIIANAWGAGEANPTSKHRIALELARRGHRVLWVEGAGMRAPSLGSGHDRGRIVRKIALSIRGVRRVWGDRLSVNGNRLSGDGDSGGANEKQETGRIWVLTPLSIPLPRYGIVRRLNGAIYAMASRCAARRLKFHDPVLINYVPILGYAMKGWHKSGERKAGGKAESGKLKAENGRNETPGAKHEAPSTKHQALRTPHRAYPRVVYHCVDLWSGFEMYDSAVMEEMDMLCCGEADVVIASSNALVDRCREKNPNSHLVMHGVDYEHFKKAESGERKAEIGKGREKGGKRQAERGDKSGKRKAESGNGEEAERPVDLPDGPIVGFFGLLSEWLDQELVLALARHLKAESGKRKAERGETKAESRKRKVPAFAKATAGKPSTKHQEPSTASSASLVLIGAADVDVSRLRGEPNIHVLGPKSFVELPNYIAHFDVGIIPFVVNELTRAVNPIKLREMMAAGCPVVSTALPEVEKYVCAGDSLSVNGYSLLGADGLGQAREMQGGAVCVARSHDEFVHLVRERLDSPFTAGQRRELSETMADETWQHKVDEILGIVAG